MIPGIWVANGTPTDVSLMYSWRPGAVTCIYDYVRQNNVFSYRKSNPTAPIIIRFMHPKNWRDDIATSARHHAEYVCSKLPEILELDPYVYFCNELNLHYENGDPNPDNQPKYQTPEFYSLYAQWVRIVADRIKQRFPNARLVTPPFAFGHHEDGAPDDMGRPTDGWAGYDYLADTIRTHFDRIITFHAYWGTASGSVKNWLYQDVSTWYAFRWKRVLKLFEARYRMNVRVIIDEAGNFGASDADFTDQCLYFAQRTLTDPRVIALTFFLWEDPTNSPGNLPNSWVQRCRNLQDHIRRMSVEIKPEQHLIRVRTAEGRVETIPLEQYLEGVLPAEVFPSWNEEALKANAVLCRSVAMYRIIHPRSDTYDISDVDQVYRPGRIHPATSAAVKATQGIYIVTQDGQPFYASYVSRCGLEFCPYCNGAPGHITNANRSGVWPGRACQWGTQELAKRGYMWRTIALFYYSSMGVTLSDLYENKGCRRIP